MKISKIELKGKGTVKEIKEKGLIGTLKEAYIEVE